MKVSDLKLILKGDIDRIDRVNVRDVALFEDRVPVYPNDVRVILKKYLSGEITSDEITKWAKFLCLRAEYCCPGDTGKLEDYLRPDFDEDYYEDMWEVIHCLSSPEIDGEVNEKSVTQYLSELAKYTVH